MMRLGRMKFVGLGVIVVGSLAAVLVGYVTSALWNALMPVIFGLPKIGFWQALGLLVLSRLIFGRMGAGGGKRSGWNRSRFVRGWMNLSPEERRRFREAMRRHGTGPFGEKDAAQS